ncbi:MAG: radical SAM family heme chaperone HemW [Elusimicrobia bacterium]|nr:radical SAM family heme chaperone HemW [Elusimicrobiota bacterium]
MPGLYIHIPFCRKKCGYCDFISYAGKENRIDAYLEALAKEACALTGPAYRFDTLYIGGGTPSLLSPPQLEKLFILTSVLTGPVSKLREATFEANPESLNAEKAALLKTAGINRISLGLQASQNRLLGRLKRVAMAEDFTRAYKTLRVAGFDNINADLMCGLPDQSVTDFMESLAWLLAMEPEHISLYALEVHEGTPFHREGVKETPDAAADMYETAAKTLEKAGLKRYEISNFAREGRQSLHNLNYWEQGSYLGLGAAAASYLAGERRTNTADLEIYISSALADGRSRAEYSETLAGRAKKAERIMLGLRKTAGIELEDDIIIEFSSEIDRLLRLGLIEKKGRVIKIKSGKLYLSNAVFREFV